MNRKLLNVFVMMFGAATALDLFKMWERSFLRKKQAMTTQSGKPRDPSVLNVFIVIDSDDPEQDDSDEQAES